MAMTAIVQNSENLGELLRRLGNIPARRVLLHPMPGTATEADLLEIDGQRGRICELVDGVLVEKPMGREESEIAFLIGHFLLAYILPRELGFVTGPDGPAKLGDGPVRFPDVAYFAFDRFPGRRRPRGQRITRAAPDLAVEVISKTNSKGEIALKLREYFDVGTKLVWIVDPRSRAVRVHTSPTESTLLKIADTLDGGAVLPGFRLDVSAIFPE